ncbi:RNA-directed DNA polymerase from mobile element jockey-like protein [Willisornis vidua]|uniref:RNA-directed DNA polymerase from mobile element jockey-like protein n=1 Tax=Willisornis vidua TaxID=1566151 RepID=A0ABQ9CZS3_9PASS|nr:RNA-directed DNA polymerase from mobile element jockey-like protein [Willisornis vidua]
MLLIEKTSILNQWSEQFQTLFSASHVIQGSAIQHNAQQLVKKQLYTAPIMGETLKAIQQVTTGKAAGVDGIPPKVWKHGGKALHAKFHELVVHCWEQGKLPPDLHDAVIITLYKMKEIKSDCSNYRGITLLPIAGKILARILLNRLVPAIAEELLLESQRVFRANRSATEMVFVLRQLQEKGREQNKGLCNFF